MEKLFAKLARQLDAIDEASLMSLWSKYATLTSRFEPTKRWEEAALIFSLIQAKRWKNQLFNYYWSRQSQSLQPGNRPGQPGREDGAPAAQGLVPGFGLEGAEQMPQGRPVVSPRAKRCRVLAFKPSRSTETESPSQGKSGKAARGKKNAPGKDASGSRARRRGPAPTEDGGQD